MLLREMKKTIQPTAFSVGDIRLINMHKLIHKTQCDESHEKNGSSDAQIVKSITSL